MNTPLVAAVAGAVTLGATPVMMVTARRTGIVDRPGGLKPQAAPVPYLGGVAVLAGLMVGVLAGAVCLGVADDRVDLSPAIRLVGQAAVGVGVLATCQVHLPGALAASAIVIVTVLLVNGVNLIDGLDVLASGVTAVSAVGFALVLEGSGRQIAVALTAALAGFLVYNRPPARIYLGDGGSYLLGTSLAVLLAEAWAPTSSTSTGVAALALVAVPAAEVAFALIRRRRGHLPLLAGDRGHPYDHLVARGWPPLTSSLAYVALATILAIGAVVAARLGSITAAVMVDVAAAGLLVIAAASTGALTPDPVDGTRR
jgi:UDP-GlcNAc:undecaprenyl-phosphate GlcNAc-1-phosphate transferase